jgi:hypothetical protein
MQFIFDQVTPGYFEKVGKHTIGIKCFTVQLTIKMPETITVIINNIRFTCLFNCTVLIRYVFGKVYLLVLKAIAYGTITHSIGN